MSLNYPTLDNAMAQFENNNTSFNNPGGLEAGPYATRHGATGSDPTSGQAIFPDMATGQQAQDSLVTNYVKQNMSLTDMINNWAPPNAPGNTPQKTNNYINFVAGKTGLNPNTPINTQLQPNQSTPPNNQNTSPSSQSVPYVVPPATVSRNLDTLTFPDTWKTPVDPHDTYFAVAEIVVGDVVVCPMTVQKITAPLPSVQELEVPGFDLRLLEFQYRTSTQGGNTILFRLFIKSWADVVQIMALAAQKDTCTVKFGYANIPDGLVGPIYAKIIGITPEFLENGYEISVEAIDYFAYENLNDGSIDATWKAPSGRTSDVVAAIAEKNGWLLCAEPTIPADPSNAVFNQHHQSDLNFILKNLCEKARSEVPRAQITSDGGKGYGPYTAYLTQNLQGQPILHYHPILPAENNDAAKPVREYVWGGLQNTSMRQFGTIVSFKPSFISTAYTMLGGSNFEGKAVDVTKKLLHAVTASGSDLCDKQIGMSDGPVNIDMSSPTPTRACDLPDHDIEYVKAQVAARFFILRDFAFNSEMTILGDPYIRGGMIVNVKILRPMDGSIMMYDWYITEAIHTISGGEYQVNISAVRSAIGPIMTEKDSDLSLPGLGAGIGQYSQNESLIGLSSGYAVGLLFDQSPTSNVVSSPTPPSEVISSTISYI